MGYRGLWRVPVRGLQGVREGYVGLRGIKGLGKGRGVMGVTTVEVTIVEVNMMGVTTIKVIMVSVIMVVVSMVAVVKVTMNVVTTAEVFMVEVAVTLVEVTMVEVTMVEVSLVMIMVLDPCHGQVLVDPNGHQIRIWLRRGLRFLVFDNTKTIHQDVYLVVHHDCCHCQ